jgi:uncharacterized membrane protein
LSRDGDTHISGLERLAFFSDGVYAIAATLLAIDIRIPVTHEQLRPEQLMGIAPSIAVYALTFVVIGLFWVTHHRMFEMIVRLDYVLVWLNTFVLLVVAFLPVPNRVFGNYSSSPYAVLFYAATVMLGAIANGLLWWYATHRRRHIHDGVSSGAIRSLFRRHATTVVVELVAMALAFMSTIVAFSLMLLYAIVSIGTVIVETRPAAATETSV